MIRLTGTLICILDSATSGPPLPTAIIVRIVRNEMLASPSITVFALQHVAAKFAVMIQPPRKGKKIGRNFPEIDVIAPEYIVKIFDVISKERHGFLGDQSNP